MITYGKFVELARKLESDEGTFFINEYMKDSARQLEEQRETPLTKELVMSFARDMQQRIRERLIGICTDNLYTKIHNDGHSFLRAIHGLASKLGLSLSMNKIDVPLNLTDALISRGYARVKGAQN